MGMPRDLLFATCESALNVTYPEPKFQEAWLEKNDDFIAIHNQFIKILKNVPDSHATSWKEKMGIDDHSLEKIKQGISSSDGNMVQENDNDEDQVANECNVKMEEEVTMMEDN